MADRRIDARVWRQQFVNMAGGSNAKECGGSIVYVKHGRGEGGTARRSQRDGM
jgi:hypothetical protein